MATGGSGALFDVSHSCSVAVALAIAGGFCLFGGIVSRRPAAIARRVVGVALVANEVTMHVRKYHEGTWSLTTCLPFHFCDYAIWCSVYVLLTNGPSVARRLLFEFVALVGSPLAFHGLLTPTLQPGPSAAFMNFVVCHGLAFAAPYVAFSTDSTLHLTSRPTSKLAASLRATARQIGFGNVLLLLSSVVNALVPGANYMFSCHKPNTASIFDLLGPWPIYLVVMELVLEP
ncbi:TIGR02206 family membrane protein [Pelomyxa schiedti]|nr:TIGR02206 family membrane protein [Pelomyxa schiedti]